MATPHLDADTLAAYVDGRLAAADLGRVDSHIDACTSCRRELSSLAALQSSEPRGGAAKAPEGTLGRYHILRELGHGSMGIVLRAYDPELARPVALKLLRDADADTRTLVRSEARALAKLRHPNVVTVYDVIVEDERMYIAMELVEGDTLRGYCKDRSRDDVLAACIRAGRGLAAAHAAGVIHRDFKPDNVLCTADGEARVSDFGLAGVAGDDSLAGALVGTPAYMAPEVLHREPATPASDQYSYCVTAYEMLIGVRPEIDSPPQRDMMPAWIWRALQRGLSHDPADRFPSVDALVDALEDDPHARRRRRRVYAAGTLVALATGALAVRLAMPAPGACAIDDSALGDAWTPARKHDVSAALAAAAGDDIAAKAVAALDDYATAWLAARRGACTDGLLGRRAACLDRGRRELGELTRVLATADAKAANAAREAVSHLRDPLACSTDGPPESLVDRVVLEEDRAALDRASALEYLGKLDDADALLAPAITRLADHQQVLAEALLVRARVESDRARHDRAEATLFDALTAAERAHDDRLVAASWVEIVLSTGAQQHRFELALSNARAADAALARIEPGADLLTRYDYTLGGMLLAHGDIAAAKKRLEAALAIAGDDPRRAVDAGAVRLGLCDAERQLGHIPAAREQCAKGIALMESGLGRDHPRVAIGLNTLGVLEFTAHDLDAAEQLYKRAIDIFERRGARDHLVYALALSNLGAVYSSRDAVEPARAQFERAIEMYKTYHPDHPQRLMPLQGLASLALRGGDAEHAVMYYQQVRDGMAATYAADAPQLLAVEFNLALAYRDAKQPARSQAILDDLATRTLVPGKEQWMLAARALDSSATLADDRKDFATSIALRERALAALSHTDDPATRAMILKQVGQSRRLMHQPAAAIAPLEESLAYAEKHAEDAYELGVARYALAMALWESGRDPTRSVELARLAADDLAKAKTGDGLQHFRDTLTQFLRARDR